MKLIALKHLPSKQQPGEIFEVPDAQGEVLKGLGMARELTDKEKAATKPSPTPPPSRPDQSLPTPPRPDHTLPTPPSRPEHVPTGPDSPPARPDHTLPPEPPTPDHTLPEPPPPEVQPLPAEPETPLTKLPRGGGKYSRRDVKATED